MAAGLSGAGSAGRASIARRRRAPEDRARRRGPPRDRSRQARRPRCATPGQPSARAAVRPAQLADDDVGTRPAHGAGESAHAESRIGHDDDGADPEAGVDDGRQGRARADEHETRVARVRTPMRTSPAAIPRTPVVELAQLTCTRRTPSEAMSMTATSSSSRRASSAAHSGGTGRCPASWGVRVLVAQRRASRRGRSPGTVVQPREHRVGVRTFLGDQVARTLEPVHVRRAAAAPRGRRGSGR